MRRIALFLLIFFSVSILALFSMKAILWTLFQWGGNIAVPLAIILSIIYGWVFLLVKSKDKFIKPLISHTALAWIWVIGFCEILFLGSLYHFIPQYFPAIVADFFFQ